MSIRSNSPLRSICPSADTINTKPRRESAMFRDVCGKQVTFRSR